jgi:proline iminopeptidase
MRHGWYVSALEDRGRRNGDRVIDLSDQARVWATISGQGPPVVLCHGGPGLWDYLGSLAALLEDQFTVVRFDQRGCGRSGGTGPFTIAQAIDDLDQIRGSLGYDKWSVVGHSWGAELVLRYAAAQPDHVSAVIYLAGVGAGDGFRDEFSITFRSRLGNQLDRWLELRQKARTPDEEHEFCLLQWSPDYSPGSDPRAHAEALWETRPPGTHTNLVANRELGADRLTDDLLEVANHVITPVTMILGADDPRPWRASDSLCSALHDVRRHVIDGAGHSPWVEHPDQVQRLVTEGLQPHAN